MKKMLTHKINVQDVLYAFYGSVNIYEIFPDKDEILVGNFIYPPKEYNDYDRYSIEVEKYYSDRIRLDNIWDQLNDIMTKNKGKYNSIEFIEDVNQHGDFEFARIVGIRLETDDEFDARVKEEQQKLIRRKKEKEKKKERILENKKKLLEKLKKELDG